VAPASSVPVSSSPAVADGPCSAPVVSRASAAALVPAGPSSVQICEPGGSRPLNGRNRPVILGRVGAGILAELLDRAPAAASACAAEPEAVLRFSYPDGSQSDVTMLSVGCAAPTVSAGGQTRALNTVLASYLDTDTIAYGLPGDAVPDLTGLTTAEASTAALRAGYTFAVSDRITDPQLPAGTVVLQDPPAGTGIIGNEIDVLVSQQPTPTCLPGQLAVDYRGVADGAGEEFANFFIRDTSPNACTLLGPVSVVGVDAAGHPVTNLETYPVGSDVGLTANTAKVPDGASAPAGTVIGWFQLSTAAIHDFDNGCPQIVTPAAWSVTIAGGTKLATNKPDSLAACQGKLDTPIPPTPITATSN